MGNDNRFRNVRTAGHALIAQNVTRACHYYYFFSPFSLFTFVPFLPD
jgi:hypothetical protein